MMVVDDEEGWMLVLKEPHWTRKINSIHIFTWPWSINHGNI